MKSSLTAQLETLMESFLFSVRQQEEGIPRDWHEANWLPEKMAAAAAGVFDTARESSKFTRIMASGE